MGAAAAGPAGAAPPPPPRGAGARGGAPRAALVGDIPRAARFLQYVARRPVLRSLQFLFHSDIACRLRSPLLMPHPYGIVIDRDAVLGSRVTVMQQVSISNAVIEDNV